MRTACTAVVLLWLAGAAAAADPPASSKAGDAVLKVTQAAIDRGTLGLSIEWPSGERQLERELVSVALVFQDASQPQLPLDATLLGKLNDKWEMGVLTNNCKWVERTLPLGERTAAVLLIVNGDAGAPNSPDFRKSGTYRINLRMATTGNRTVFRGQVQAGLFEQTDSKQGHESSTSFRALSNVVDVK